MSPPLAVRLAADLRPSADGSAVRTCLMVAVAKLQTASVPIAYGSCAPSTAVPLNRQTNGSRYRLMPTTAGGHDNVRSAYPATMS